MLIKTIWVGDTVIVSLFMNHLLDECVCCHRREKEVALSLGELRTSGGEMMMQLVLTYFLFVYL